MRVLVLSLFISIFSLGLSAQNNWTESKVNVNGDLVAVYFPSADRGWVAGDNGYLASTNDGGRTWVKYPLNTTEDINEIYFRNEKNGYLVAGRKMFLTNDAGASWRETMIYKPGDFKNLTPEFLSIRFADKKYGYVIGSILNKEGDVVDSLLMRTDDEGLTWRRQIAPTKAELFHLDFSGTSHGWIVGDKGVIIATTDRGETWHLQRSGTTRALFSVDFRDDKEGFAVGGGGTILKTEDGGNRWDSVKTAYQSTLKRVDFADDKSGWIVGFNGTLLRSQDRGRSWEKLETKAAGRIFGLNINRRYGYAVGENGLLLSFRP